MLVSRTQSYDAGQSMAAIIVNAGVVCLQGSVRFALLSEAE